MMYLDIGLLTSSATVPRSDSDFRLGGGPGCRVEADSHEASLGDDSGPPSVDGRGRS